MNTFTSKTIIVPWDFSETSRQALNKAVEIAGSSAQVKVVHVTPYPDTIEPSMIWGDYDENDIRSNLKTSFFASVSQADYPGLEFFAVFGSPGSEIADFAEKHDAGLIVISSHGQTRLERFLIGSVAERVIRLAHCPVLVLRPGC
ncbi:MAG: universal stress protein [Mariniblastus sp.]|nr:universal stress protein [Mariniblastus sp.]